jgi:hypothetical protein
MESLGAPAPQARPRRSGAPRIEAARRRASSARRSLSLLAVAAFGASVVLVRVSHPASHAASASGLTVPPTLLAQLQGTGLGGGSITPTSDAPTAATSTS